MDTPARDSLACVVMEPIRPQVDAFLLDWVTREPLKVGVTTIPNNNEIKSTRTWQQIAAEPAKEMDSEKLLALAIELERALEAHDKTLRAG
jgi:hypothetical protein